MSNPKPIINGKWEIPTNLYEHDKTNENLLAPINKPPLYFKLLWQHPKIPPVYILLPPQQLSWHCPHLAPISPWLSCHFYFFIIFTYSPCFLIGCLPRPQNGGPDRLPGTRIIGGKGICVKLCLNRGNRVEIRKYFIWGWGLRDFLFGLDWEIPMFMRIRFSWKLLLISMLRWISTLWKNCNSEIIRKIPNLVNILVRSRPR